MKLAVVSGFPPADKQGEANYSGLVFRHLLQSHPECNIVVYAHQIWEGSHESARDSENGIKVKRITNGRTSTERLKKVLSLIKALLVDRPDVIHYQGTHTGIYGLLFGEPMILVYLLMRLKGFKQVITIHSTWFKEDIIALCKSKNMGRVTTWLFVRYYRIYLRLTQRLVNSFRVLTAGTSGSEVDKYVDEWKLNTKKVSAEPHACSPKILTVQDQQAAKVKLNLEGKRTLLTTGFIRPDKGIHLILDIIDEIFELYSDVVLIIAGEPSGIEGQEYASALKRKITGLNHADRVIYKFEFIDNKTFDNYFYAADLVIVPYLRVIGASGPIHHALSSGKAVVATNIGHNKGLSNEIALFEPNNSEALFNALKKLLQDPQAMRDYQQRSAAFAVNHSWSNLSQSYYSEYQEIMGK